MVETKSDIITQ